MFVSLSLSRKFKIIQVLKYYLSLYPFCILNYNFYKMIEFPVLAFIHTHIYIYIYIQSIIFFLILLISWLDSESHTKKGVSCQDVSVNTVLFCCWLIHILYILYILPRHGIFIDDREAFEPVCIMTYIFLYLTNNNNNNNATSH